MQFSQVVRKEIERQTQISIKKVSQPSGPAPIKLTNSIQNGINNAQNANQNISNIQQNNQNGINPR
jgi:hypothetical protein